MVMVVALAAVIGFVAGVASGVAGIGGGIILIPAMVFLLGMEQHLAQGTSTLAILFTAVAGTMVNVRNRRVDLRTAFVVGLGGSAAAFFASRAALALDPDLLQRLFGLLVLYSGTRMGVRAWQARTPD